MNKNKMDNCQIISFSPELAHDRLSRAQNKFDSTTLNRIKCYALYLQGVNRKNISVLLNLPPGTVRSFIRAINHNGLPAFQDRRRNYSNIAGPPLTRPAPAVVTQNGQSMQIALGNSEIKIPLQNPLQCRTILLTLLTNNLITTGEVARALKLSHTHVLNLSSELQEKDISGLIDKRKGPKQEYRFVPEVKAELIQQYIFDLITEGVTSGKRLSEHLRERCALDLSDRSIRYHLEKMGLNKIKRSLPNMLNRFKKNFTS